MGRIVNILQFHPMDEEDMFRALREVSEACAVCAWIHADNISCAEVLRQKALIDLPDRLSHATQSAAALGITGVPLDLHKKFVYQSRSKAGNVILSDYVYDTASPRLWEMLEKYEDDNAEFMRMYTNFYRMIRVGLPDYVLYCETGVAGMHVPGLI